GPVRPQVADHQRGHQGLGRQRDRSRARDVHPALRAVPVGHDDDARRDRVPRDRYRRPHARRHGRRPRRRRLQGARGHHGAAAGARYLRAARGRFGQGRSGRGHHQGAQRGAAHPGQRAVDRRGRGFGAGLRRRAQQASGGSGAGQREPRSQPGRSRQPAVSTEHDVAGPRAAEIYDTTLRDGAQGQDVQLTSEDKVAIARRLDAFGVDYIEGGWPGSNPKDARFFEAMKDIGLQRARLSAFVRTRHRDSAPEDDANLTALIAAATPVVAIFGKSWTMHVTHALNASLEQNLEMSRSSVAYLKGRGKFVIYDAEHYFDGYAADADYALATLSAAVGGGADRVVLCDTNGGSLPGTVARLVSEVVGRVGVPVGIH